MIGPEDDLTLEQATALLALTKQPLRPKQLYTRLDEAFFPLDCSVSESMFYQLLRDAFTKAGLVKQLVEPYGGTRIYEITEYGEKRRDDYFSSAAHAYYPIPGNWLISALASQFLLGKKTEALQFFQEHLAECKVGWVKYPKRDVSDYQLKLMGGLSALIDFMNN